MKQFLMCVLFSISLIISGFAQEADGEAKARHQAMEGKFEKVVQKFVAFFENQPRLIYKAKTSKSESGYLAFVSQYTCEKVDYAVSTVHGEKSSFSGTMTLLLNRSDNRACGDVPGATLLEPASGYSDVAAALDKATDKACYRKGGKSVRNSIRLDFVYKSGVWELQEVFNLSQKKAEPILSAAFGKVVGPAVPIEEEPAVAFNQAWEQLTGDR